MGFSFLFFAGQIYDNNVRYKRNQNTSYENPSPSEFVFIQHCIYGELSEHSLLLTRVFITIFLHFCLVLLLQ